MKITELRIGNIVGLQYYTAPYFIVMALDLGGSVHLYNREYPDEIRDINGVELTQKLLGTFNIGSKIKIKDVEINLIFNAKRVTACINGNMSYTIKFVHELQNIIYTNTGQELLDMNELIHFYCK